MNTPSTTNIYHPLVERIIPRCPRYPNIFPELELEERTKSLFANFKAFRFPSTARVNFVATIRFCQDACQPVSQMDGYFRKSQFIPKQTILYTDILAKLYEKIKWSIFQTGHT